MNLICSNCKEVLRAKDINITTNLGKCANCQSVLRLNELASVSVKPEPTYTPPADSGITMNSVDNDELLIELPKKGINASQIPTIAFALFWLLAIGFFTYISFGIDLLPVLFSIPFWLVGILMILGVIRGSQESQKITITKDAIKIEHSGLLKKSVSETKLNDIQEVLLANAPPVSFANYGKSIVSNFSAGQESKSSEKGIPTLLSYANSKTFFETTTEENQVWIVALLDDIVKKSNS